MLHISLIIQSLLNHNWRIHKCRQHIDLPRNHIIELKRRNKTLHIIRRKAYITDRRPKFVME